MDTKQLFKGIAVIIDNEIEKESRITDIKRQLEYNNIPVVTYTDIPNVDIMPSLSQASFIILDWDYFNNVGLNEDISEVIAIPDTLRQEKQKELISFIKALFQNIFIPIFIFTAVDQDEVIFALEENGLWEKEKANRIFVKQKTEISNEQELFNAMTTWLKEMPSVYVLKEWEKIIHKTKNEMFLELYKYSSNWVSIFWKMMQADSIEHAYEFGSFITKHLINRINQYEFEEDNLTVGQASTAEELRKLIEVERYLAYTDQPNQAYVGDLFKEKSKSKVKYYLNVRAQCDLARTDDAELYLITGKELDEREIMMDEVRITSEAHLKFEDGTTYELEKILAMCAKANNGEDTVELEKLNKKFQKSRRKILYNHGEILEKKPEAIVACIDNGKIIIFKLDLVIKKFSDMKDKRIGRLLSPHINRIQQKCSQYITREGVMPIPQGIFSNMI